MRDFIVGLGKAATERGPGASPELLERAESQLRLSLPEDLKQLYRELGGAEFQGDVSLHPLFATEETTGVIEQSRLPLPDGLPAEGLVRFGLRGGAEHLFAVARRRLPDDFQPAPEWLAELEAGEWLYGVKNLDSGKVVFHRTLEALLRELVPPAQGEGFGENTFIRAFNAVQSALESATSEVASKGRARVAGAKKKARAAKRKAVAAKKKPRPSKKMAASARKAAARKPIAGTKKTKTKASSSKGAPATKAKATPRRKKASGSARRGVRRQIR